MQKIKQPTKKVEKHLICKVKIGKIALVTAWQPGSKRYVKSDLVIHLIWTKCSPKYLGKSWERQSFSSFNLLFLVFEKDKEK